MPFSHGKDGGVCVFLSCRRGGTCPSRLVSGIFRSTLGFRPAEVNRRAGQETRPSPRCGMFSHPPLPHFRKMMKKLNGGQPGKGHPPFVPPIVPPSRRPAAEAEQKSERPPPRMQGSPPPCGSASAASPPPGTGGPDSSKAPSCEIPCCAGWRRSPDRCGRAHRERPAGPPRPAPGPPLAFWTRAGSARSP